MTPTPDMVRARFIEAAHTARIMPAHRIKPAGYGAAWPDYLRMSENSLGKLVKDSDLWGGDRFIEERASFFAEVRLKASAEALSRHDECMAWTAELLEERLRAVTWAWAFAAVAGKSFRKWCRADDPKAKVQGRKPISPQTGYNRVERACEIISTEFRRNGQLMRLADETTIGRIAPNYGIDCVMVGDRMSGATSWRADDAIPAHRPEMHERVKLAEAKRRALLGAA